MKKFHLDCFYAVSKFQKHSSIKADLLELINNSNSMNVIAESAETNITRADWNSCYDDNRPWKTLVYPHLKKHLTQMYYELGYHDFILREIWFQQYGKNSQHGWHVHSSAMTNVYYVDLPEGTPKTQLINPFDQSTVIEVDVEEGDTLVFPSFVLHRAPPNVSDKLKTIISYNVDFCYPDSQYGKNILK